jgi:methionine-rich copper-binding protein CopC
VALLVCLSGGGAWLASAPAAQAHANYERSQPRDDETLAEPPERVDVWFTQEIRRSEGLPTLIVVNESGDEVQADAVLDDDDRTHMYAELPPALPPGRYTVIWHTFSDEDGEKAQGAFHYFVGEGPSIDDTVIPLESPAATEEPTAGPTPTPEPTAASADDDSEGGNDGVAVWLFVVGIVGGAVVGAGGGMLLGRRLR